MEESRAQRLAKLYLQVQECQKCSLGKTAWLKAIDWNALVYMDKDIPFLIVGMSPAYCEDRTGVPLVGAQELLVTPRGCGRCSHMHKECFPYFLHQTDSYKVGGQACFFGQHEGPVPLIDDEKYGKRLGLVQRDVRYTKQGRFYPSTAGELLDYMLQEAGINRPAAVQVALDAAYYVDGKAIEPLACHAVACNVVQCRSYSITDGIPSNRPPTDEERALCEPWVKQLIEIVQPKAILAFGLEAVKTLVNPKAKVMKQYLDQRHAYQHNSSCPVWAFYHPSYYQRQFTDNPAQDKGVMDTIHHDIDRLKQLKEEYC